MIYALSSLDGWQAGAIVIKTAAYFTGLSAAGGAVFLIFFARHLANGERAAIARITIWLALTGIVASFTGFLWTIMQLGGGVPGIADSLLLSIVFKSHGAALVLRTFGLLLTVGLLRSYRLAALGSLLVILSFAQGGHSAALDMGPWPQLLIVLHIAAVTYWIGALPPLLMMCRRSNANRLGAAAKRFGDIAAYVVGTLVVAGVLLLWMLGISPAGFIASDYGRIFTAKLVLVAGLVGLAALNKLRLTPAILAGDATAPRRMAASIRLEIVAVLAILLVTATFTTVTGPPVLN